MSGYGDIQRRTDGQTDGRTRAITKDPVRLKTGVQNSQFSPKTRQSIQWTPGYTFYKN